jgi:hypothetical protein
MTGFSQWANDYCRTFGITAPAEKETVQGWERLFELQFYDVNDLRGALGIMAVDQGFLTALATRYAGKMVMHFDALSRRLRELRAIRDADARREHEQDYDTCTLCGNSGWVEVPHPADVRLGQWFPRGYTASESTYYTAVVYCRCWNGQRVERKYADPGTTEPVRGKPTIRSSRIPATLTLERYEAKNPHWPEQMAARAEARLAEHVQRTEAERRDLLPIDDAVEELTR